GNYTVLVREMIASCGTSDHPTPIGTYRMQNDYKRFGYFVRFDCYAQYWSLIVGKIYFHSIPYLQRDSRYLDVEGFYKLGSPASHGCVRLLPDDAHWVYLYLCPGTVVQITNSRAYDKALRARLLLIELPVPDAYEIAPR
ncbi:MAG: L,D-transpeptidase, partial [Clostridia bacterium]|nr:L,D-transpeptidase [Clostridia bacterium]